jgi:hypothetical protein
MARNSLRNRDWMSKLVHPGPFSKSNPSRDEWHTEKELGPTPILPQQGASWFKATFKR